MTNDPNCVADPNLPSDEEHRAWVNGYVYGVLGMHARLLGGADAVGVRTCLNAAGISIALAQACGVTTRELDTMRKCNVKERIVAHEAGEKDA